MTMRDGLAGRNAVPDFPDLVSAPRSRGGLGPRESDLIRRQAQVWFASCGGHDTAKDLGADAGEDIATAEVDGDGLLAILRAKAARAQRDPGYAAELEWAARAGQDDEDDGLLDDDDLLAETEDLCGCEAAEEARAAALVGMGKSAYLVARFAAVYLLSRSRVSEAVKVTPARRDHRAFTDVLRRWEVNVDCTLRRLSERWLPKAGKVTPPLLDCRDSTDVRRFDKELRALRQLGRRGAEGPSVVTCFEALARVSAENSDADAAAYLGSWYEHRGDPERAMTWYLRSHFAGSEWGTLALARISYDQGARDHAARLLSKAWGTDAAFAQMVLLVVDAARTKKRRDRSAVGPPEELQAVVDRIRAIPPVLPAESFDAGVGQTAGANVLVLHRNGDLPGDVHEHRSDDTPRAQSEGDPSRDVRGLATAGTDTPLLRAQAIGRLVEEVRRLEARLCLSPGGDARPLRDIASRRCGSPDQ
ncbi:hypothetical protein GCM10023205_25410 [Yinghuangia aomiensis]|uniref:Uncharacterized protein n=1 Tax=Yinghuangia aomiensis TaxID=676205 RepID=A0ABP9H3W5_9ACTN